MQTRKSRVRGIGEAVVVLAVGILLAGAALSAAGGIRSGATNSACSRAAASIRDASEARRFIHGAYAERSSVLVSERLLQLDPATSLRAYDGTADVIEGPGWSIVYHYVAGPPASYWLEAFGCG